MAAKKDFRLPLEPLDSFDSKTEYKDYWSPLYKYEIYNRLFSDKDLGQNLLLDDKSEVSVLSQQERSSIWMGFCEPVDDIRITGDKAQ